MFWPILAIVSIIVVAYPIRKDLEWIGFIAGMALLISIIATPIAIVRGVTTYTTLLGQLQKIKILQQEALDPMAIVEAKVEYNFLLAKARYYKRNPACVIFGHGFFISDKVFQLPKEM